MVSPTTNQDHLSSDPAAADEEFANLVEQITRDFEAHGNIDETELLQAHPQFAKRLKALLPSIRAMVGWGNAEGKSEENNGASVSQDSSNGLTVGEFRILREIGRGGMGVVYEAYQTSLGRRVALKVLPFAAMLDKRQLVRFKNEAQAAASLTHQHIVPVYAIGSEKGVHYYAMQYVEGQPLSDVIIELRANQGLEPSQQVLPTISHIAGQLTFGGRVEAMDENEKEAVAEADPITETPLTEGDKVSQDIRVGTSTLISGSTKHSSARNFYYRSVAEVGIQAAEALEYAHQQGVIHRDIKPSNLMLDADCQIWLADFGLARIEANPGLTMTGDILGTLRYMSPEQALAKRVVIDHRTDIYSLGATLYELLTLEPLFGASDRQELLRQIAFEEPRPPRRIDRTIPADLETILLKAVAKNPAERYSLSQDLADDLKRYLDARPIRARRATLVQRLRKWAVRHSSLVLTGGVAAALMLLLGMIGLALSNAMVSQQRDAKDRALEDLSAAYEEKDQALTRAEANLDLAMDALDAVYLKAIGRERLLNPKVDHTAPAVLVRVPLTAEERQLLEKGLGFYEQFAEQNTRNLNARFKAGQAYKRVARIRKKLGRDAAAVDAAHKAIENISDVAVANPSNYIFVNELGEAFDVLTMLPGVSDSDRKDAYDAAIKQYTKAIDLFPTNSQLYRKRGTVFRATKQEMLAFSDFKRAMELDPNHASVHWQLAGLLLETNDSHLKDDELAVKHAREAVRLEPNNYWFNSTLIRALIATGNFAEAIAHARKYAEIAPTVHAHRLLAETIVESGEVGHALESINEAIRVNPHVDLYRARARVYKNLGRHEEALADFNVAEEKLSGQRMNPWDCELRGEILLELGRYREAVNDFTIVIEDNPAAHWGYKHRAEAYMRLGRYEEALEDLDRFLELEPDATSALSFIDDSFVEGLEDDSSRAAVMRLADRVLQLAVNPLDAHLTRVDLFDRLEMYDHAEQEFATAAALVEEESSTSAESYFRLGDYLFHRNRLSRALPFFEKCLRLNQHYSEAYDHRGWIRLNQARFDQAIFDFQLALDTGAAYGTTSYEGRGIAYLGSGDATVAGSDFTKLVELDPGYKSFCKQALVRLVADDWEGYRADCSRMMKEFAGTELVRTAYLVAWTCALAPDALQDYSKVISLARMAVEREPEVPWYPMALGATLYRAGEFTEAFQWLGEANRLAQDSDKSQDPRSAMTWFLLAMTQHQLENPEEATQWVEKASHAIDSTIDRTNNSPYGWHYSLTLDLLREEAQAMLEGTVADAAIPDGAVNEKGKQSRVAIEQ